MIKTLVIAQGGAAPAAEAAWWREPVLANEAWAWFGALGLALVVYIALEAGRRLVKSRLGARAAKTATRLDDLAVGVVSDVRRWCIAAVAAYAGSAALVLPHVAAQGLKLAFIVAVAMQVLLSSRLVVDFAIGLAMARGKQTPGEQDRAIASASAIIRFIAMLVLGTLLLLLALSNMGVQVTPLLTGLGIGGIAVALAAQSILGDLFGSLTIVFDKPFLVGDFIVIGNQMGTVEHIGVKTTRVRALSGEQLVFTNTDLLSSRIQNFKRMAERRVVGSVGIVYETPLEKVERVPAILRECIAEAGKDLVRIDRVHFKALGDYALQFEYVYFSLKPDFNVFMDIQQAVNLGILRRFEAEGISVAYPTAVEIQRDFLTLKRE